MKWAYVLSSSDQGQRPPLSLRTRNRLTCQSLAWGIAPLYTLACGPVFGSHFKVQEVDWKLCIPINIPDTAESDDVLDFVVANLKNIADQLMASND